MPPKDRNAPASPDADDLTQFGRARRAARSPRPLTAQVRLFRLVYVSRARIKPPKEGWKQAIQDILTTARTHNESVGITGALLFNGVHFAQVLEGREDEIKPLYERIRRDSRHFEVTTIEEAHTPKREFSAWAMAYVDRGFSIATPLKGEPDLESILYDGDEWHSGSLRLLKYLIAAVKAA
jgi:Sensors of blue-light using FAD